MLTPWLVNGLAFVAVFLMICAANAVLVDLHSSERRRLNRRMEEQLRRRQRERARQARSSKEFSQIAAEAIADNKQGSQDVQHWLRDLIEQSGVDISLARVMAIAAICGGLLGITAGFLFGSFLAFLVATLLGSSTPIFYLCIRRRQRRDTLREQLPDAFDLMARVLRAGQTISQAMQAVADEFDRPISLEFLYCYEQMNLGLSPEAALRELGRRTGILEIRIFVLAVLVHRQTGGNLAELLDKLAHVVRERSRIRGMISSLTAQGRFQACILLSLPPFMFVILMILHREYEMMLFDYPLMIGFALGMMAIGALWIHRIVSFDF